MCATDLLKGIVQFSAGTRHYAAAFVSPLVQMFTFVSDLSNQSVAILLLSVLNLCRT